MFVAGEEIALPQLFFSVTDCKEQLFLPGLPRYDKFVVDQHRHKRTSPVSAIDRPAAAELPDDGLSL